MKFENIVYCTSLKSRFLGLMFKKNISEMCFPKCHAVHTFFMKKNIDIVMTDKENKIIAIYKNVSKNKIISNKKAYNVYELPINKYKVKLGMKIT